MILTGKKYKDKIQPRILYRVESTAKIRFTEHQEATCEDDIVEISFILSDKQYAIFGKEYCPGFLASSKKVDIFFLVIDEENKKYASWICDVKVSVGGKKVIEHLIEQWKASYKHKTILTNYLEQYSAKENVGVITRDYQTERIQLIVDDLKNEIDSATTVISKMPSSSIKIKQEMNLLKIKKEFQMFKDFKDGWVTLNERKYPITVYKLEGMESPYYVSIKAYC